MAKENLIKEKQKLKNKKKKIIRSENEIVETIYFNRILLIHFCFCSLSFFQGVLMVQDQYRAVMQYTHVKEALGKDKIATDWYCAKVSRRRKNNNNLSVMFLYNGVVFFFSFFASSVVSLISNDVKIASNVMHPAKKVRKAEKEAMKLATY